MWLALRCTSSVAKLEKGDQSRARGHSNAVYATLARMFCPPLNPEREREVCGWRCDAPAPQRSWRGKTRAARGRSNAVHATLARMFYPPLKGRSTGKPGFPMFNR